MATTYSDVNPRTGLSKFPELVLDEQALNSSIENILGTHYGERWYFPTFGSNFEAMLYEPVDDLTAGDIELSLFEAIREWEPRVSVSADSSVVAYPDQQMYKITINYTYAAGTRSGSFVAVVKGRA